MNIKEIGLQGVIPAVFAGDGSAGDDNSRRSGSGLWLRQEVRLPLDETTLIEAESGAGKTSLCAFIYGLRTDYIGRISFDGRDIRELTDREWTDVRRTSLAYLPQEMMLFSELTARENVQVKNRLTGRYTAEQIDDMLARLGLADKLDTPARIMSIGQQQRVAIVRALCQPFNAILLDEPVSHLDVRHNRLAAELIEETARDNGAGIISTSVGNPLALDYKHRLTL